MTDNVAESHFAAAQGSKGGLKKRNSAQGRMYTCSVM